MGNPSAALEWCHRYASIRTAAQSQIRFRPRFNRAMPTVLRIGPHRFHFYSRENDEPPHIHVTRDDIESKFWLQDRSDGVMQST